MKAVQVTRGDDLLQMLQRDPEARRIGRSAFLRVAARERLARTRQERTDAAYVRGYARNPVADDEFQALPVVDAWRDLGEP
jgi:metal-responsive CopG/Arc/MetJ family transcriptional regulator